MPKPDFTVTDVYIENDVKEGGIDIGWKTKSAGFGHVAFTQKKDGSISCMNEGMGKGFIKRVLERLVEKAELQD